MRKGIGRRFAAIAAVAMASTTAFAQPAMPDPRGQEAVDVFMTFCVSSMATSAGAHALLDDHPEMARPLDAAGLAPFTGLASKAREGWLYKAKYDTWLALAYIDMGHGACEVVAREADAASLKSALTRAVDNYARLIKAKVDTKPVKRETINAVPTDTLAWEMTLPDTHRIGIIASVGDQPAGNKQALFSFFIEH